MTSSSNKKNVELIFLLALMAAIGSLSIDTYLASLPQISQALKVSPSIVQQTISAYFIGIAGGQILTGPLSDRFGRRPILIIGFAVYFIASIACATAPNITVLIIARAAQGFGASAPTAAGRAVIRDVWSGDYASRAMSFVMMVTAFAPFLAPIMGSYIFYFFGWRPIFWFLTIYSFITLFFIIWRLKETNGPEKRLDVKLGDFFRAYLGILKDYHSWGYLACCGFSFAALFAYITAAPFVYIDYFGIEPKHFGYLLGVNVIAITLGNLVNAKFVTIFGNLRLLGSAIAMFALSTLALLICSITSFGGLPAIVITMMLSLSTMPTIGSNTITGLMNLFPKNAGAAAALCGIAQFGFAALAGVIVGLFPSKSPAVMGITMSIMAVLAILSYCGLYYTLRKKAVN